MDNGRTPQGTGGRSDCQPLGGDFLLSQGSVDQPFPGGTASRGGQSSEAQRQELSVTQLLTPGSRASSSPTLGQAGRSLGLSPSVFGKGELPFVPALVGMF